MKKKEYMRPELKTIRLTLRDVILYSPEELSTHYNGDDLPDPIFDDPDDDILW